MLTVVTDTDTDDDDDDAVLDAPSLVLVWEIDQLV